MFRISAFANRLPLKAVVKRGMAGGHKKEYVPTGKIDAVIRGVFKEDHQVNFVFLKP